MFSPVGSPAKGSFFRRLASLLPIRFISFGTFLKPYSLSRTPTEGLSSRESPPDYYSSDGRILWLAFWRFRKWLNCSVCCVFSMNNWLGGPYETGWHSEHMISSVFSCWFHEHTSIWLLCSGIHIHS